MMTLPASVRLSEINSVRICTEMLMQATCYGKDLLVSGRIYNHNRKCLSTATVTKLYSISSQKDAGNDMDFVI
jgi:hypothetical protein